MEDQSKLPEKTHKSDPNCNDDIMEKASEDNSGNEPKSTTLANHFSSSSFIQESSEFQWCMDDTREYDEDDHRPSILVFNDIQSSYDDISKNIDVNLAEIDMETFCSQDINSILSLPAMHGESVTSLTDNTQNTSESCSSNGKMETTSHSLSDAISDTSLYKNKPLFSPVKEHDVRLGTISTDSLDFASLEKQDPTSQTLKNNYVIAFEASITQMSEQGCEKDCSGDNVSCMQMIRSEIGYTGWNTATNIKENGFSPIPRIVSKGKSLPLLPTHRMPLFEANYSAQNSGPVLLYDAQNNRTHSLKPSNYQTFSSAVLYGQSVSADSHANTLGIDKNENLNDKSSRVHPGNKDTYENNNFTECNPNNNLEISIQTTGDENSSYFEDSLMEAATPKNKFAYSSPIKEEEPCEFSSGDETLKSTKGVCCEELDFQDYHFPNQMNNGIVNKCYESKHVTVSVSTSEDSTDVRCLRSNHLEDYFSIKESASQSTQTKFNNSISGLSNTVGNRNENCLPSLNEAYALHSSGRPDCYISKWVLTKTRNNSTQIPVYIKDKSVQTCLSGIKWKEYEYKSEELDLPFASRRISASAERSPVYVCYPNYSLPDLSFLNLYSNVPDSNVKISPPRVSPSVDLTVTRRRARSSEGRGRPKSYANEQPCPVSPIIDWPSLSVLLPDPIKNLYHESQERRNSRPVNSTASSPSSNFKPPFLKKSLPQKSSPKFYPLSAFQDDSKEDDIFKTNSKRWSLQEPIAKYDIGQTKYIPEASNKFPNYHYLHVNQQTLSSNLNSPPQHFNRMYFARYPYCSSIDHSPVKSESGSMNNFAETAHQYFSEQFSCSPQSNSPTVFTVSPSSSPKKNDEVVFTSPKGAVWVDLVDKKAYLLQEMKEHANAIIQLYSIGKDFTVQDDINKAFQTLSFCRVLYDIVADDLKIPPSEKSILDCVWKVVGATALYDNESVPFFHALYQEVCEQPFQNGMMMFCSFVVGLMNMGWIGNWLMYFLSCTKLIEDQYKPSALPYLLVSKYSGDLQQQLSEILKPLQDIPFNLELSSVLKFLSDEDTSSPLSQNVGFQGNNSDSVTTPEKHDFAESSLSSFDPRFCMEAPYYLSPPLRKTVQLKDKVDNSGDNRCSSQVSSLVNKNEFEKFQKLRQRWEKLSSQKDAATVPKQSLVDGKPPEKRPVKEKNYAKATKSSEVKAISAKIHPENQETGEAGHSLASGKRRSMIPIHKGMKALGNRRSSSLTIEKENR